MSGVKRKIALLSNITIDLIAAKLRRDYEIYVPEGFDAWVQETINPTSLLYEEKREAVILLLDGTEARSWRNRSEAEERILLWQKALEVLAGEYKTIPIFVSTIDIRENRIRSLSERKYGNELENTWYQFVQALADKQQNIYVLDLADLISEIGRRQFYSNKMWYLSNMPYSRDGLNAVVREIRGALSSAFEPRKKIIVLDLDNTLWGGVIGEDGIDGIELADHKEGQRYYDFQRQLLEMKKRGILLAVVSKNNEEDARKAISEHPSMLLREDDFVTEKINWENKAVNIKEIESELNLTEGSFIFIDDNPIERGIVSGKCTEMYVPEFPADTTELLGFAEDIWLDYCRPLRILGEDTKKTQMYQSEAKRKEAKINSLNLDDYIASLDMYVDVHRMRPEELERTAQLCGKTNQFNLTTKRYTVEEIASIAKKSDSAVYVVHVTDKYGDSGLISVIILAEEQSNVRIDTFLMSCRVMGRKLEDVIMNEIASRYSEKENLIGEYKPTEKNVPVKNLYERLGFKLLSENDGCKIYQLSIKGYEKKKFEIYKEVHFSD